MGLFGLWDYRTKDKGLLDERLKGKRDPYSYKQIKDEKNKESQKSYIPEGGTTLRMRLLPLSATQMLPLASAIMPCWVLNSALAPCPSAKPGVVALPAIESNTLLVVISNIRPFWSLINK